MQKGITAAAATKAALKPVEAVTSTTTQNVAGGVVVSGGTIAGACAFVRSAWPDALPWGSEGDAALVVVLTTIIGPLVSRVIAMIRDRYKAPIS